MLFEKKIKGYFEKRDFEERVIEKQDEVVEERVSSAAEQDGGARHA